MSVKFTAYHRSFLSARRTGYLAVSLTAVLGAAALLHWGTAAPASAHQAGVEVGVLNCRIASGTGFVIGSSKQVDCVFERVGRDEHYIGEISKLGIDIGTTAYGAFSWGVLAPTGRIGRGALAGSYGGVSGEATVGIGVGVNALIGGSSRTIMLQPVSLQTQEGLNIAAGVAALELRPIR